MSVFLHFHRRWLLPLVLFALFTPWSAWLDVTIEHLFYTPAGITDDGFMQDPWIIFVYRWGPLPAQLIGLTTALILLVSYATGLARAWRHPCWFFLLTLLIGAVAITHGVFKDHWGRPRPRQVLLFGGQQPFRPYYKPNFGNKPEPSKSFACGHCTAGFFFFAVALLGEQLKKRWLQYSGYVLALLLGGLLGGVRMAQGGHFLSDVLASALIMWETSLVLYWWLYYPYPSQKLCLD